MDKHYTVFVDGKLHIDFSGSIINRASWAGNGLIFTSLEAACDFVDHLSCYCKFESSVIEVIEVMYEK